MFGNAHWRSHCSKNVSYTHKGALSAYLVIFNDTLTNISVLPSSKTEVKRLNPPAFRKMAVAPYWCCVCVLNHHSSSQNMGSGSRLYPPIR